MHHQDSGTENTLFRRRNLIWLLLLLVLIFLLFQFIKWIVNAKAKPTPVSVVVAASRTANVPVFLSGLGSVTPTYNVTVRTQINGTLLRVLFREGQMVKAGELLAEIDPRPYQAQLVEYEGQLIRDQALLDNAMIDLKRYQTLWKQDSIAQQTLATQASLVKQYQGAIQVDQGLIQATKVNLYYCEITSPVNGRIGLRLVDAGNFVTTADTSGIAVITTLDPITVIFTLPEDNIPDVRQRIYANEVFSVQAFDREQTKLIATGKLITIDNQIDPTTGTVKLKAEFENSQNHLFPNQFVNIKLLVKTLENATIIPTAGIQFSTKGPFVYVLNENHTVSIKPVTVGVAINNDTVITSGVRTGQFVVVEGADKLTDGATVTISSTKGPTSLQLSLLTRSGRIFHTNHLRRFQV